MLGLHMGWFAGPLLRWIYFLLGLSGAAMVGTGLVLWTVKRQRPDAERFLGLRIVERLNIGAVACLPAGMAAFFLANRLLPATAAGRADAEVSVMFWVWFGLAALACLRPIRRAWIETLSIAAIAFLAIPIVNALTTNRGLLHSISRGETLFISFDAAMLISGALLAFGAWRVAARAPTSSEKSRRVSPLMQSEMADAA
jgi:hypothetical protein